MSEEPAPLGEIILYQTEDGPARVECRFAEETIWLSQALMAELFQKDVRTINEHLKNLVAEGEIDAEATIRNFRIVRKEGGREVTRQIEHYNLDAILAGGVSGAIGAGDPVSDLVHGASARIPGEGLHDG